MTVIKQHHSSAPASPEPSAPAADTLPEGSHDEIADYLTDGYQFWSGGRRNTFPVEPGGMLSANVTELTEVGQQLARWALEAWTNVSGIRFEFVEHEDAHIVFDDELGGASASLGPRESDDVIVSAHINVSKTLLSDASYQFSAFYTYLHEIGHALGLGHAGPYNGSGTYGVDNIFLNDSVQFTAMSYFYQDANTHIDASYALPVTPMIADIIAMHNLYGVPADINSGDTVYGYRSNVTGYLGELFQRWTGERAQPLEEPIALTLYDSNGIDTLDLRTDRQAQRIDLRPEGVSDVFGLKGNLIIARGVLIENVSAGAGDDIVIGNAGDNHLQGHGGADELRGGNGNDILEGGAGADRLDGGAGLDMASYRAANATVTVDLAADTIVDGDVLINIEGIIGSAYDDILRGDAGSNRLEGGPGGDRLDGGGGADWLVYRWSDAGVTVNLGANRVAGGDAEGDEIINFEHVTGSAHADRLRGDAGSNELDGGDGDDLLEGGGGADRLLGGAGEDTSSYEHSSMGVTVRLHALAAAGGDAEGDRFGNIMSIGYIDRAGNAQVENVPDIEHLRGSAHADILAGDSRANRLEGGAGADRLYGGPGGGDDILHGGAGADALYGGIGDDVLEGGADADLLRGGAGVDTASYRHSDAAVLVRLSAGMAQGGHAEGDVIADIENITGSAHSDSLSGDEGANVLEGGGGADQLDGGGGVDWLSYRSSPARVIINLVEGRGRSGHAEGDTFAGLENITGSAYNDELRGDGNANHLDGGNGADELRGNDGDDMLEGGGGADRLYGGAGADTLSYRGSDTGVQIDLALGTASGGHGAGDTFNAIENITGSAHRDILTGDDGVNYLDGAAGDDALHGAGGADRLVGGGGADELHGGAGNDDLRGNAGADVLYGGADEDQLEGGGGADELHGGAGGDSLRGNAGADELYGGADDDQLFGGDGDDRLQGNAGADRLDGGSGNDWASYTEAGAGVVVSLELGRGEGGEARGDILTALENLVGSAHDDVLRGDGTANILRGLAGADELYGNGGDDVLEGGAGADRLDGGAGLDRVSYRTSDTGVVIRLSNSHAGYGYDGHAQGDILIDIEIVEGSAYGDRLEGNDDTNRLLGGGGVDWLIGSGGADHLDGGAGVDTIDYSESDAGVTVNLAEGAGRGGYAEGDRITDVENVVGSEHPDILTGNDDHNELNGGYGDDELYGGDGNDILKGGPGADRMEGGPGRDVVDYLTHPDTAGVAGVTVNLDTGRGEGGWAQGDVISGVENIVGTYQADLLVGDGNKNTLHGHEGDDELVGKGGPDHLEGHDGNDTLRGDEGDDLLGGGSGDDVLYGGDDNDNLYGQSGGDMLYGGDGNDYLRGDSGNDALYGGDGDDHLVGDDGADRIEGGAGNDELFGQPSRENTDGSEDVFVFAGEHGEDIIYNFADAEDKIDLTAFNLSGFAELDLSVNDHSGATIIDLSTHGGGKIELAGLEITDLDASDFLF